MKMIGVAIIIIIILIMIGGWWYYSTKEKTTDEETIDEETTDEEIEPEDDLDAKIMDAPTLLPELESEMEVPVVDEIVPEADTEVSQQVKLEVVKAEPKVSEEKLVQLISAKWSPWSTWSDCTKPCGGGMRHRTRSCIKPKKNWDGVECSGLDREDAKCNTMSCQDSKWSGWSKWSKCSKQCGVGKKSRTRVCNKPSKYWSGKDCIGSKKEEEACEYKCEPGKWSKWGKWMGCKNNLDFRIRTCIKPKLANWDGTGCAGSMRETKTCSLKTKKLPGRILPKKDVFPKTSNLSKKFQMMKNKTNNRGKKLYTGRKMSELDAFRYCLSNSKCKLISTYNNKDYYFYDTKNTKTKYGKDVKLWLKK